MNSLGPGIALGVLLLVPPRLTAQSATGDSIVVAPIAQRYAAGGLHQALLGREYRDLWVTPISIPVLDLEHFGGGLTPVSRGGGQQTTSLRLRAADGQEYFFRSIDKDPSPNLPEELRGTIAAGVVQDQISSAHPTAPLVVAPLLEAAGVLHGTPRLFILPDDARLGEFRALAGLIGLLEPRVAAPPPGQTGWGGASDIIGGDSLFARVERGPDDRVDARALLRARLVDLLVGDWDRHRDQWGWAAFGAAAPRRWQPIPRDRDFAMIDYDGLLLGVARNTLPQLITFGRDYPDILGLTWNARELDRHFLMDLDRAAWDTVTALVQAAITDSVIGVAVATMPPEHQALDGARMADALRHRRDALAEVTDRFYRMLSREAEIHATDAAERAVLTVLDPHTVELALTAGPDDAARGPYLRRRFRSEETRELRLFLRGGADTVRLRGGRLEGMQVRIIGGDGADVVQDSSGGGWARLYDEDPGTSRPASVPLDPSHYQPPPRRTPTEIPVRDWGHRWQPLTWASYGPDLGLFLGGGRTLTTYGFRALPFRSRHRFRAGIATEPLTYRVDYLGQFRGENSTRDYAQLLLRASGIEVLNFHGFGNEIAAPRSGKYYRVTQNEFLVEPALLFPLGGRGEVTVGPTLRYVTTDHRSGRFLATVDPYGDGEFGEVGARLGLTLDTRNRRNAATRGILLSLGGSAYPGWWDVRRAYGEAHGEVATYLSAHLPLDPTLALRVGGKKLWGPYPYFDAAFIGGRSTVRLGRENRYAGDASSYASSELRLALGRYFLGAAGDFGVFGLADAGRVYLEGEDSRKWHGAAGGGVWFSLLDRANTLSVALAHGEERTRLYVQAGFGF